MTGPATPTGAALGYRDPRYVDSLTEWGDPMPLPRSGGWLLARPTPIGGLRDARGPYPLLACADWEALDTDLAALAGDLVSVVGVTDPFGAYDEALLHRTFGDLVRPFRRHYIVDLEQVGQRPWSRKLEQTARRALRSVEIEVLDEPAVHAATWSELYRNLIDRHGVTGIRAFSAASFERLLAMPGVTLLLARSGDRILGGQVYLRQGDVVHCHLGAVTPEGYQLDTFHAMDRVSLERFAGTARWLDLGGGQGDPEGQDGLARYKARWATDSRWTWLVGRILDPDAYAHLVAVTDSADSPWFPAYRTAFLPAI
ncbi:MAG: GNAT family N-acetyltransferase [Chloroflexota bacterium]